MSSLFHFSFHDMWEISLLSNTVSQFYGLNPFTEVEEGVEEAFVQGLWWKPGACKSCTNPWIIKPGVLSLLVFLSPGPGRWP